MPLLVFLVTRHALGCFVGMPLGFLLLARFGARRTFLGSLLIQFAVAGFAALNIHTALPFWVYGAIGASMSVPFWVAYHTAMVMNTTGGNRGNEVVVGDAGLKIGSVIGSLLGGVALMFDMHQIAIITAAFLTCGGTAILIRNLLKQSWVALPSTETPPTVMGIIFGSPMRTVLTILDGAVYNFTFMLAPVWLKILGLGGMMVGVVNSLSVVLNVIVAPLVGMMANKGDSREVSVGSVLSLAGWLPWAAFSSPLLLAGTYLFWSAGAQFTGLGLMCRWYEVRSVHALAAREILLGVGRILSCVTMLPILYIAFTHFAWASIVMASLLTATSMLARKRALQTVPLSKN